MPADRLQAVGEVERSLLEFASPVTEAVNLEEGAAG
jgi:hypothetical protein